MTYRNKINLATMMMSTLWRLFSRTPSPAAVRNLSWLFCCIAKNTSSGRGNKQQREAEQNISRVQSCPPVTARAARALEDNLKGKWGQKVFFFPNTQQNYGKTGEKLLQDCRDINPLWLCREESGHLTSGNKANDFAACLKPPSAQACHLLQDAQTNHKQRWRHLLQTPAP